MSVVPSLEQVTDAVEKMFGGRVTAIHRQLRWRPTWFVDVDKDGRQIPLVVRGDRTDSEALPLRHEFKFHSLLEEHGIKVPHLYGFADDISAVVMERVPGKPDFGGVSPEVRDTVVDEYVQLLAKLHSLDPQPFIDAGIYHPQPGVDPAIFPHQHMERRYRERKTYPDPFAEFGLGWLKRHPPKANGRLAPCIWDTGQFHHHQGHLVVALDLEFGCVADPMVDLTVWRMRDTLIDFGDFRKIYDRYAELTGTPVDLESIMRHHFGACLGNQLQFGAAVAAPVADTDQMNYMQWNSETNLMATEFLAEYLGIDLPGVEVPEARATRQDVTFEHMVNSLKGIEAGDPFMQHEVRLMFRTARHLYRSSQIGAEFERQNSADVAVLTGQQPEDWQDADRILEAFCIADAAEGKHDEALIKLFHKRHLRLHMTLGPAGSSMVRHYRCQRFDGTPVQVIQY